MTALPRAILFDLDDTIISAYSRPDAAWLVVVDEFADRLAPLPPLAVMEAVMTESRISWEDPAWQQRWRMRLNEARRGIVIGAFRRLAAAGHAIPSDEVAVALADRYSAYRQEQMHLFPGAHAVIDGWKQRGVKLALVTNGAAEVQRAKIARFDLAHRFDHIQIEGEHDFGKPDERAYRHALAALDADPATTWMVGDNLEWEVAAPQRLGIFAIWHDVLGEGLPPGSAIRPDRIIRSFAELMP
ncbi:MAG: HAD family hydrolase [Ferrovibrionaceae bacterium]|jgi:putative hydrolase of the HAD superfamily